MKSEKKLKALYKDASGDNNIYPTEEFIKDAKQFIKDVEANKTICSMKVSRSGMTRTFNYQRYNRLLNLCYNSKFSNEPVKVGGCGMDMHWYLEFRTCEQLATKSEIEKGHLNSNSSKSTIL